MNMFKYKGRAKHCGHLDSPTTEAEHDICGVSPMDVHVPGRIQEAVWHELLGFRVHLEIPQDRPVRTKAGDCLEE